MGCISRTARAIAIVLAFAVGLAGALPTALGHAHAHLDEAAHVAAADAVSLEPGVPDDHGRRHAGGGCHGTICWSMIAQPIVLTATLCPSLARTTSGIGLLPSGPDLQGEPPVPRHG